MTLKAYGWKARANEYVGRGVEWLERVVTKRVARRQGVRAIVEQETDESMADIRREVDALPEACRGPCCGGREDAKTGA